MGLGLLQATCYNFSHIHVGCLRHTVFTFRAHQLPYYCCSRTDICDILKAMSEIAIEDDDLRARAVYDCCHFDALLGFGMNF